MNTRAMKERIAVASPRLKASITGLFYLLTIIAGGVVLIVPGRLGLVVVTACYLAVAALFYDVFQAAGQEPVFARRLPQPHGTDRRPFPKGSQRS